MTTNTEARAGGLSRFSLLVVGICWFAIILDGYDLVVYGAVVPSLLGYLQWNLTPPEADPRPICLRRVCGRRGRHLPDPDTRVRLQGLPVKDEGHGTGLGYGSR